MTVILFEKNSGFWRFFPSRGKWEKIEFRNHNFKYSLFNGRIINSTFFTLAVWNSMEVFDFSKTQKDINSFAKATGLTVNKYDNYSAVKFQLKFGKRVGYFKTDILNNNNLLQDKLAIKLLKHRQSINYGGKLSLLSAFRWKNKQHFLFKAYKKSGNFRYRLNIYTINPDAKQGNKFEIINVHPPPSQIKKNK